jgi:hypothetical protein
MIDRFNFYDLYGYLIPGIVLAIIGWLPFGILYHWVPPAELGSLAAVAVVAYLLGYFLQAMATNAVPSSGKRSLYPSVRILNASDSTLSSALKSHIASRVHILTNLQVHADKDAFSMDDPIARVRQDAFFVCRPIANKAGSYSEQFQGLYAMMRGISVAAAFGAFYMLGWSLVVPVSQPWMNIVALFFGVSLLFSLGLTIVRLIPRYDKFKATSDLISLVTLAVLVFSAGYWLALEALGQGRHYIPGPLFEIIAILLVIAAMRFFIAYKSFTEEFAKAIWRHFGV